MSLNVQTGTPNNSTQKGKKITLSLNRFKCIFQAKSQIIKKSHEIISKINSFSITTTFQTKIIQIIVFKLNVSFFEL